METRRQAKPLAQPAVKGPDHLVAVDNDLTCPSNGGRICRICWSTVSNDEYDCKDVISPCQCKGSMVRATGIRGMLGFGIVDCTLVHRDARYIRCIAGICSCHLLEEVAKS